jgi:hypothetical protein
VHGADEIIVLLAFWLVTTAMMFAIVMGDERDLTAEELERAWPPASRAAAIVAFGPFALPVHFAKTRGDFKSVRGALLRFFGLALGVGCAVGMLTVASFVVPLLLALFGIDVE